MRSNVRTLPFTAILSELGAAADAERLKHCDVFLGAYWQSYGCAEAGASRYEGRHMSPSDALAALARDV